jgi:hypothetical protein
LNKNTVHEPSFTFVDQLDNAEVRELAGDLDSIRESARGVSVMGSALLRALRARLASKRVNEFRATGRKR